MTKTPSKSGKTKKRGPPKKVTPAEPPKPENEAPASVPPGFVALEARTQAADFGLSSLTTLGAAAKTEAEPFGAPARLTRWRSPSVPDDIETLGANIGQMSFRQNHVLTLNSIPTGTAPTAGTAPIPVTLDLTAGSGPKLPEPGPGPRLIVRDEQLDIELHRSSDQPPPSKRSSALLRELREAARDFANSFDPGTNAHRQIRNILDRYRAQIDLDDPDVNLIFARGLRLENADLAARRSIVDRFEPELEDGQREALSSVLRMHAVFIVSEPEGAELLAAAERYAYRQEDDERFKELAEPVVHDIASSNNLATERVIELLEDVLKEVNQGEHPARAGMIGRNTIQRTLVFMGGFAVSALVGPILAQSDAGREVITEGVLFTNKAIEFFLTHTDDLRALAATANDAFGFLTPLTDWIRSKLDS